jgi:hypothetical protein
MSCEIYQMRLTELSPFVGRTCLWFMVFNATFNNIADIVADSFIGGGNRATWRKPPTDKFRMTIVFTNYKLQTILNWL